MHTDTLMEYKNSFLHSAETETMFWQAMQETFLHHRKNCEFFRQFYARAGFEEIKKYSDIALAPPVFVDVFKNYPMKSVADSEVIISLSSSGTGGKKSFIHLDQISIDRIQKAVFSIFDQMGMYAPEEETNYLCFTYDPYKAGDVGTAFSDKMLTGLTGRADVYYAIKVNGNDYDLDIEEIHETLERFENSCLPLRILGFPSYTYKILTDYITKKKRKFLFPKNSFIITGGGWKLHSGEEIPKEEFKGLLADMIQIPVENIRDHYGCVEHGIPYVDCEYGNMHIPVYADVFIRDPGSMKIVDDGPGLMELVSPYCRSYPSMFLLTADKGEIKDNCPCGRGKYIVLHGRAGKTKLKGCGITAAELLNAMTSR